MNELLKKAEKVNIVNENDESCENEYLGGI